MRKLFKDRRMYKRFGKQWASLHPFKYTKIRDDMAPSLRYISTMRNSNPWMDVNFPNFDREVWDYALAAEWIRIGLFGSVHRQVWEV